MDVQHFERLLSRYERLAGLAPRLKWLEKECDHLRRTLATAQEGNRRRDRDMEAAEKKIEEWMAYADHLRGLLTKKQQQLTKGQRPKPLETEIPF
jgi:chromosome segregation ATPase